MLLALSWTLLALAEEPAVEPKPEKKVHKWQVAALPVANVSSDTGIGYGAYAAVVRNAPEGSDDPFKARVAALLFWSTKKYQDHNIEVDFPGIFGSKYRVDVLVGYEAWKQTPYFGYGNETPRIEEPPELPTGRYYEYDVRWYRALTNVRRNVGGPWDVFGSYMFRFATVDPYAGSLLDAQRPVGTEGGRYARLGAGVMYDTRDTEPSTTEGIFDEASIRISAPVVGSQYTVFGVNFTDRRWVSLDEKHNLILANRVIVDLRRGDEPLFSAHVLGGSSFTEFGGALTLRGLANGRYRGDWAFLVNPELRWKYASPGPLDLWLVPFFDLGRVGVWPDHQEELHVEPDSLLHLHYAGGAGLRFQLGQSMLVRADAAFASEEYQREPTGLFDGDSVERRPAFGFYLVFDHPY